MTDQETRAAASLLGKLGGAKGGRAGTGEAKVRGDAAYYRKLAKARWRKARRVK